MDWARVAPGDSYIPSSPPSTTTMYTLAQLHTTSTRESKSQVGSPPGDNLLVSPRIIIAPLSTYSRSLSQFVLCRGGAEGGLGGGWWQISGPDSQPGLKIA